MGGYLNAKSYNQISPLVTKYSNIWPENMTPQPSCTHTSSSTQTLPMRHASTRTCSCDIWANLSSASGLKSPGSQSTAGSTCPLSGRSHDKSQVAASFESLDCVTRGDYKWGLTCHILVTVLPYLQPHYVEPQGEVCAKGLVAFS